MGATIHYRGQGALLAYSGTMTFGVLDETANPSSQIEQTLALFEQQLERHPAVALLFVVEHGTRTPTAEERKHMKAALERHGERLTVGYAMCGLGFWASALRVVLVGISRVVGAPVIAHGTVKATAEHLARELIGVDAALMMTLAEQLRAQLRDGCAHENVIVDDAHPHHGSEAVSLRQLRFTPPGGPEYITLSAPRCGDCGRSLSPELLGARVEAGGDCYDARFIWPRRGS